MIKGSGRYIDKNHDINNSSNDYDNPLRVWSSPLHLKAYFTAAGQFGAFCPANKCSSLPPPPPPPPRSLDKKHVKMPVAFGRLLR